ncbi:hypothetical protein F4777DRAFT_70081 [Nemania sp. FL0916]|nr:hypothetical protein F4777DRAFT_70081 [Nemania sp. FL0916]
MSPALSLAGTGGFIADAMRHWDFHTCPCPCAPPGTGMFLRHAGYVFESWLLYSPTVQIVIIQRWQSWPPLLAAYIPTHIWQYTIPPPTISLLCILGFSDSYLDPCATTLPACSVPIATSNQSTGYIWCDNLSSPARSCVGTKPCQCCAPQPAPHQKAVRSRTGMRPVLGTRCPQIREAERRERRTNTKCRQLSSELIQVRRLQSSPCGLVSASLLLPFSFCDPCTFCFTSNLVR